MLEPMVEDDIICSYLLSTPFLDRFSLRFNTLFKTLHCMVCLTAHPAASMARHLKNHEISMASQQQEDLLALAQEHGILMDRNVVNPSPNQAPVEGLSIINDGFSCTQCFYCAQNYRTFQNHVYQQHSGLGVSASDMVKSVPIQNFFPSQLQFFAVDPSLAQPPTSDPFELYLKNDVPKLPQRPVLQPPTHTREIPPLLQITGWQLHLEDHIHDKVKLKSLLKLMDLPSLKDDGPRGRLRNVVWEYMKQIRAQARSAPLNVRCMLLEWPRRVSKVLYELIIC
jgi:hypothetical protein